ncbi:hypothetical protein [Elizabethkingia ursingii]|uniref:hypothetical protein n=1 Tax=Elizabethkingia ursingii TaxID=1756150 RepID=UPI00201105A5|nr:hypothetical protein [Elizabethkingia ursingii]MCL1671694.1 hypothetical protein [Elizabethkingia ursingii]
MPNEIIINVTDENPKPNTALVDLGLTNKMTYNKDQINELQLTGITGDAELNTQPSLIKNERWYATIVGTYMNFKEIVNGIPTPISVLKEELEEYDIILSVTNGISKKVFSKKIKTPLETKFDINSNNAISNGRTTTLAKVLDSFIKPAVIRSIPVDNTLTGLMKTDGTIVNDLSYRRYNFTVNTGEKNVYFNGVRPVTSAGSGNQQLYPTIIAVNNTGVMTGILDSKSNTDPNPYDPIEIVVSIPSGTVSLWVVWQSIGGLLPLVRTMDDDMKVTTDAVKTYIDNKMSSSTPAPNNVIVPLSKYSGPTDPALQNGYIDKDYMFINSAADRCGFIDIPAGAQYITSANFDCPSYLQFATSAPTRISGGATTSLPLKIPTNATRVYFNVRTKNTNLLNTSTNTITFNTNSIASTITTETLQTKILETADNGRIMIGEKLYCIDGIEKRLYTESLFSGFDPRINFNIEPYGDAVMSTGADKGRFILLNNPGSLTIKAFDLNRNLVAEKSSTIYKKPMPTFITNLPSNNKMQVMFIGDSLWNNNQNGIGKEWLRMLNTNDSQSIVDGIVYKEAFNLGSGRIELVGKQGASTNMYTIANSLELMMESAVPYNNGTTGNPFFRPDSGQPNELDDDGFNKQMDIAWFIQSVCGAGKYPKYIYFACGVNDIYFGGWRKESLPFIKERLKRVLYRIKKACDTIAGGNSGVQILLVNHQFYPLNQGHSFEDTFSNSRQRKLWAEHYINYENAVKSESYKGVSLSSFVRFVDCASSFDIANGYNYLQYPRNNRSTVVENTIDDTVHIGTEGALLYADALLDDFLYHECQ